MADSAKLPGGGQKASRSAGSGTNSAATANPSTMNPIPPASQPSPSVKKAPNPIKVKKQSQ